MSDTYLTQYFQLDKKPIEVNKQRIQAICPEFFEQYYDEDRLLFARLYNERYGA